MADSRPRPVQLHLRRWNPGGPRRALLVHGLAGDGGTWWRLGNELAGAGFEVTAPDLRGHGLSPIGDRYRFADFAADLAPLGSSWDLIVGHSLGGPVVAELLRELSRSGRTGSGRTVLLDPVLEIADDAFDAIAADQIGEADAFADPDRLAAANPTWHPLDAHTKAAAARSVARATVAQVMADNRPWHALDLLDGVGSPVLVLGADPARAMCPPAHGDRLTTDPMVRFRAVPGAGHSLQREAPAEVLAGCLDTWP